MRVHRTVWLCAFAFAFGPTAFTQEPLRISVLTLDAAGRPRLEFSAHTNRYYLLDRGDTLANIAQPVAVGLFPGASGALRDGASTGGRAAGFFRLRAASVTAPLDSDGDGIDDVFELRHRLFLNPLHPADAALDLDGNGQSALDEYRAGGSFTVPRRAPAALAGGWNHSLALQTDGSLWAWGNNSMGALGNGTTNSSLVPTQVGSERAWADVAAATGYTVARKRDGTLWTWGDNRNGQLGLGHNDSTNRPARVGFDADWRAISCSSGYTLALKTNGTIWGWGLLWYLGIHGTNAVGSLTEFETNAPVRISEATDWMTIASGGLLAAAIKSNGTLWCWNYSAATGQPGRVGADTDWAAVAVGFSQVLLLKRDGSLWSAANPIEEPDVPVRIGTDNDWIAVAAGLEHALALKRNGQLWAWGSGEYGQLGTGGAATEQPPTRVADHVGAIATGLAHSLALKLDGSLWSWGANRFGALGNGTNSLVTAPAQVGTGAGWNTVSVAGGSTVGVQSNGTLWAWGRNTDGELGTGGNTGTNLPTRVGADGDWATAHAAAQRSVALKRDGSLWEWGSVFGNHFDAPRRVGLDNDWSTVISSTIFSLALKTSGTLWRWGAGFSADGQRDWDYLEELPVPVGSDADWVVVATGSGYTPHVAALKRDGSLWTWGPNSLGQLGLGCFSEGTNQPTRVGLDSDWAEVSLGNAYSMARKRDGSLWAWGYNRYGQLGTGVAGSNSVPERVGADGAWTAIAAGLTHTVALQRDGSLWAWGLNVFGQFGDGAVRSSSVPVRIGLANDWAALAAGSYSTFARKTDGTLWAWGDNAWGQISPNVWWVPTRADAGTDWGWPAD